MDDLLLRQARQFLENEFSFGLDTIARPAPVAPATLVNRPERTPAEKETALELLRKEYAACMNCALSGSRTKLVFGAGNPDAKLMFIGEAPGNDEDQQGVPFVGAAGQLLTKIIEAMKLTRDEVYIANCLKCRPPQNRNPLPEEIARCSPILLKQIEIIRPKIICALGKFAAQTLLGTEESISRLRGRYFDYAGTKLMPTFHPAYLLRNPGDKKIVWEDMKKIMKDLDLA